MNDKNNEHLVECSLELLSDHIKVYKYRSKNWYRLLLEIVVLINSKDRIVHTIKSYTNKHSSLDWEYLLANAYFFMDVPMKKVIIYI